jgi:hypothetical protein
MLYASPISPGYTHPAPTKDARAPEVRSSVGTMNNRKTSQNQAPGRRYL